MGEPPPLAPDKIATSPKDAVQPPVTTYQTWHQGPFIVIITSEDNIGNLHPMRIGKALYGQRAISITKIEKKGRNRLEIYFPTSFMANQFLESKITTELGVKAHIPFHRTSIVGVAKGIPTEFTNEEIKTFATTQEGFPITNIHRFNRKVVSADGTTEWLPTQTIKITFQGQRLPERLYIYGATARLEPYSRPILQCRNCQQYGHLAKYCKKTAVCPKCAEHHGEADCTSDDLKCTHCSLKHRSTDKMCPRYILQTKIHSLMLTHNIPFSEAREIYQGNKTFSSVISNNTTPIPTTHTVPPVSTIAHNPDKYPRPVKRKVGPTSYSDNYPRLQHKQLLIAPDGRTPSSPPHPLTRPVNSLGTSRSHVSQQTTTLSSPATSIDRPSSSPSVVQPTKDNPAMDGTGSSCPSFKLIDMATFTVNIAELKDLNSLLPEQFQKRLSVIINKLRQ